MVYIANLAYNTKWMALKDLMREKGGDVNYVEILETNGRSKGCACVFTLDLFF